MGVNMDKITIMGTLLSEANVDPQKSTGKYSVKVIQPGWGSSGYYAEQVLKDSAPLFEGSKMFWNHPTSSDQWERPERDLRDLSGVLTNVHYDESNPSGAGIYGDATVFDPFSVTLQEIAPYIGVSIRAGGTIHDGEAEGRTGPLVDSITNVQSVDFVTTAGAGGKVLAQFAEAAKSPYEQNNERHEEEEDDAMELKEAMDAIAEKENAIKGLNDQLKESADKVAVIEAEMERLREGQLISECAKIVSGELKEAELPEITKDRIQKDSARFLETTEEACADGTTTKKKKVVNTEKVKEAVQEAIKNEASYISKLSGGVQITGMGSQADNGDEGAIKESESLEEAFMSMGLSESAAKIAANGR